MTKKRSQIISSQVKAGTLSFFLFFWGKRFDTTTTTTTKSTKLLEKIECQV
jgi:hypothetical protein